MTCTLSDVAQPKTNKIAHLVKQTKELEAPATRPGQAKKAGLYLVELRSHHAVTQSSLPRRKLVVSIEPGKTPGAPRPIKITYHT